MAKKSEGTYQYINFYFDAEGCFVKTGNKRIAKIVLGVLCVLFLLLLGFFIFMKEQEKIIAQPLSSELFRKINSSAPKQVGLLFDAGETLLCKLGEYESFQKLKGELNNSQFSSVAKSEIAHGDLFWNILFFSNERLTRAYTIEKYSQFELAGDSSRCNVAIDSFRREGLDPYFNVDSNSNAKLIFIKGEKN